jgi:hypothetical protein
MLLGGWIIVALGAALWIYGLNTNGMRAFVDWPASVPPWFTEALPNLEAESGFLLVLLGLAAVFLPKRHL